MASYLMTNGHTASNCGGKELNWQSEKTEGKILDKDLKPCGYFGQSTLGRGYHEYKFPGAKMCLVCSRNPRGQCGWSEENGKKENGRRWSLRGNMEPDGTELTDSPIKILTSFTLKEMENQVLCFNNIIQAAGLRIDCRGEGRFRGRDEAGWGKGGGGSWGEWAIGVCWSGCKVRRKKRVKDTAKILEEWGCINQDEIASRSGYRTLVQVQV